MSRGVGRRRGEGEGVCEDGREGGDAAVAFHISVFNPDLIFTIWDSCVWFFLKRCCLKEENDTQCSSVHELHASRPWPDKASSVFINQSFPQDLRCSNGAPDHPWQRQSPQRKIKPDLCIHPLVHLFSTLHYHLLAQPQPSFTTSA
jgi:hypothetical protein